MGCCSCMFFCQKPVRKLRRISSDFVEKPKISSKNQKFRRNSSDEFFGFFGVGCQFFAWILTHLNQGNFLLIARPYWVWTLSSSTCTSRPIPSPARPFATPTVQQAAEPALPVKPRHLFLRTLAFISSTVYSFFLSSLEPWLFFSDISCTNRSKIINVYTALRLKPRKVLYYFF